MLKRPLNFAFFVDISRSEVEIRLFQSGIFEMPIITLQAGAPATTKRTQYPSWYQRDGDTYTKRVELVKNLKKIWNIDKI